MASKYETLRNNILEKYSGEDSDERLGQLDYAYDLMTEFNIASPIETNSVLAQSREAARAMFAQMKEKCAEEKGKEFAETAFGKMSFEGAHTVFNKGIYTKLFGMKDNVMRLAQRAGKYISDGNHAPVGKDERDAFNKYISIGTAGNLSYSDVKAVMSMVGGVRKLDSQWLSNEDNYNGILNSINGSEFSDEVKNIITNALNQASRRNRDINGERDKIESDIVDLMAKRESDLMERKNNPKALSDEEKYKNYIDNAKYKYY